MYRLRWLAAILTFAPAALAQRVVAVVEIHGGPEPLTRILRTAQVLDAADRWAGGRTQLVVSVGRVDPGLGDVLNRLQAQADRAGGRVHVLHGPQAVVKIEDSLFAWEVWYRSEADLDEVMRQYGVRRIVMGHGDG